MLFRSRDMEIFVGAQCEEGRVRLVRGSHIVIPRVNRSENAIAYFEPSGRIVFVIPWGSRRDLSLVGTTDIEHDGSPDAVHISTEEVEYLSGTVKRLFPQIGDVRIVSTFSSLRPLVAEGSASPTKASRGHRIRNDGDGVLHISGGKYTTYRAMSEEAADLVCAEIAPELRDLHLTAATPLNGNTRERIDALLAGAKDEEIGRASCRERV